MPKLFIMFLIAISCLLNTVQSASPSTGALSVSGNKIVGQNGNVVNLAGIGLFWSNDGWGGEKYYNASVINWVKDDWNVKITRAAMGVEDIGGYISNPINNKNKVKTVVNAAIDAGIYVIIDWHSHEAELHESQAINFLQEMANLYGTFDNVIYEIYNEPECRGNLQEEKECWSNDIKPYAEAVIRAIRVIDPDNLIIVGSPTWSQAVDVVSQDPITGYSNIAYSLHFYAATHKQSLRDRATRALDNGIALMVTEWGTVDATKLGPVDHQSTDEWMSFLAANNISHINWALNDKPEGASALKPGASPNGSWPDSMLTESGLKVKGIIKNWR